ncbi:MAG: shikimate kinase [Oscillospiraceae bacterium]|jgi:shikimate kinase|nr:shikimate kinase [Oscillospiraceae bacterium]
MRENIVLCGFMGCGKTTIARRLSRLTYRNFIDIDKYIQHQTKMSVSDIFRIYGEPVFRNMEHEVCGKFRHRASKIIATGGGTVTFERNVKALKAGGLIVLLDLPLEQLQERLAYDKKRPLLQVPNRNEVIEELYNSRIDIYRSVADVTVNAGQGIDYVALELMKKTGIL